MMTDTEEDLRAYLHRIADEAQTARGADAAESAVLTSRRRLRRNVVATMGTLVVLGVVAIALSALFSPRADPGSAASTGSHASQSPSGDDAATAPSPATGAPPTDWQGPADPQVGVAYPFSLLTHCGIDSTVFGGRSWRAENPQPEPLRKPDDTGVTTYTGYTQGTMTLVDSDRLEFTVTDPLSVAVNETFVFVPQERPAQPSPPCA